jgi:hypothetical protein
MQAPGEAKQHFAPTDSAPSRIALLGIGALGDDAVAIALAHQPAHAGRLADPSYEAHRIIVRQRAPRTKAGITERLLSAMAATGDPNLVHHTVAAFLAGMSTG